MRTQYSANTLHSSGTYVITYLFSYLFSNIILIFDIKENE